MHFYFFIRRIIPIFVKQNKGIIIIKINKMELYRAQVELKKGDRINAGSFFSEDLSISESYIQYNDVMYCIDLETTNVSFLGQDEIDHEFDVDEGIVKNAHLVEKCDFFYNAYNMMCFHQLEITEIIDEDFIETDSEDSEGYRLVYVKAKLIKQDINKSVQIAKNNKEYNLR